MTVTSRAAVQSTRPALGYRTYAELLDMAEADGVFRQLASNLPQLRLRYCRVEKLTPASEHQPCASCGGRSSRLVDGIPLHLGCPDPQPSAAAAAAVPTSSARAGTRTEHRPDGSAAHAAPPAAEHLVGVLAGDGLWLPGAAAPAQVSWPRTAMEAYQLAEAHRVRQLWIHPSAHARLGIPAERDEPNPQKPQPHEWVTNGGGTCDPPGLAAWVNVQPGAETRRRALVFVAYEREDRADWKQASTGQVLLAAVEEFNRLMPPGCNYYYSPNETSAAVIRHHNRGKLQPVDPPPPALTNIRHIRRWSRVLTSDEEGGTWLHPYDVNGQQLATWNVNLGVGPAVHKQAPQWSLAHRRTPGYWLTGLPDGWHSDPLLPDLRIPWERSGEEYVWLPTPYLELLTEVGAHVTVAEAWIWTRSSAWLQAPGKTFRLARQALVERDDEPAQIARGIVKSTYASRVGEFSPHDRRPERSAELVRHDASDMVIGKAFCNDYRREMKIGQQSGRWPVAMYADTVYYVADDPDPEAAAPAGMVIGTGLGQYSTDPAKSIPLAVVAGKLGEPGFHGAVERFLRGPGG
jgi:hypothetical protein